jgi:hypothetical protein
LGHSARKKKKIWLSMQSRSLLITIIISDVIVLVLNQSCLLIWRTYIIYNGPSATKSMHFFTWDTPLSYSVNQHITCDNILTTAEFYFYLHVTSCSYY